MCSDFFKSILNKNEHTAFRCVALFSGENWHVIEENIDRK